MPKCPPGVIRRKTTTNYHYRRRIPLDLVAHYGGRKERAYSLGTSDYRTACAKARLEAVRLDQEFEEHRAKLKTTAHPKSKAEPRTSITELEMDRLALLLEHSMLKADEDMRQSGLDDFMYDRLDREHEERLAVFRRALARGDVSVAAEAVDDWLWGHGFDLDRDSDAFKTLGYRFLKTIVSATDRQAQRHLGEVVNTPPAPAPFGAALDHPSQPSTSQGATSQAQATIALGKAVDLYTQEKRESGEWQNGTEYKEGAKVRLFAEIMGLDRDLGSLTIDDMRDVKAALLRFPSNRNKLAQYRDMTMAEVLKAEVPEDQRLQPTTLKNYFNKIGAFLKWAKKHRYHSDPTIASDILTIKATKQDHEHRSPLTTEDISLYFSPDTFPRATENSPAMFWVSVMGLFTGARLEELCQLYLSDIVEEDGVWCFAFRPDRPDKLMKTLASRRFTPIAPFLTEELNFLVYVDKLKAEGQERLFPELTPHGSDSKYSHYLSRRLGAYRASIGLRADAAGGKKDFHSFRGTVAQWCEERGVPEKLAARIIGHKYGKMTYGRYTTDTRPSIMMREVVARLDYGMDLDHLQLSPHVVKPGS